MQGVARHVEYAGGKGKAPGKENVNVNGTPVVETREDSEVLCGPLLNYKGMSRAGTASAMWRGSVLLVTRPGHHHPTLHLKCEGSHEPVAEIEKGLQHDDLALSSAYKHLIRGEKLYEDPVTAFWRFDIDVPVLGHETRWTYTMASLGLLTGASPRVRSFLVPSTIQSMRIMFHSCNGFSTGTKLDAWSGPALWNDVLRMHEQRPFHVMIGGGNQIYNDGVRERGGPLHRWKRFGDWKKRRDHAFDEDLRAACDHFYCNDYIAWYSTEPFSMVIGEIPQVNVWNDHDIIDGFGSYKDDFMQCAVFHGIGGVAFKYYCLFQHHIPPPASISWGSTTTQPPEAAGKSASPTQLSENFVLQGHPEDDCFIMGGRPGPYINECSRSLYLRMGARVAFLGIDTRTERTRQRINYEDTYELIVTRIRSELANPGPSKITHLIVLLGVPIAYPRLTWLENVVRSPLVGSLRFIGKRFGIGGGLINKLDGQVGRPDELDDHYTAPEHNEERKYLILQLQELAEMFHVRITILGGDVRLAAVGRFYANSKLRKAIEQDERYMANIISSAIMDHPRPRRAADALARKNKIYHLDENTDETLMNIWNKEPGGDERSSRFNKVAMRSRNYAILSESSNPPSYADATSTHRRKGFATHGNATRGGRFKDNTASSNRAHKVAGEDKEELLLPKNRRGRAGSSHRAASGVFVGLGDGALDVCFRVEIDRKDKEGRTEGYGFEIPALDIPGGTRIVDVPGASALTARE